MSPISRRNLFKFVVASVSAGLMTNQLGISSLASTSTVAKSNITPDKAIDLLFQGNQRFANQKTLVCRLC